MVYKDNIEQIKLSDEAQIRTLNSIKRGLRSNSQIIAVQGVMKLTKTARQYAEATLYRDLQLEEDVKSWLSSRVPLSTLIERYASYDSQNMTGEWPQHFPMRILRGQGSVSSAENIFMFFPEVLGLQASSIDDYFGFEFIDVWRNIFEKSVFQCCRKILDEQSQLKVSFSLRYNLEKTIYLASVFHEIGHRVGPYRVSPFQDERLKISQHNLDILGELATDSLLVLKLKEFPELAQFVILQRILWFARRGFRNNPLSANSNLDNDSWIGLYLWNKLVSEKIITFNTSNSVMNIQFDLLPVFFQKIIHEIDLLSEEIFFANERDQDSIVERWKKTAVHWDAQYGYMLDQGLKEIFILCQEIEEVPFFLPAISN